MSNINNPKQDVIYFDFNSTYPPSNDTILEMCKWAKKGNISSNYTSAEYLFV
jgi:hypothetical protein